MEHLPAPRWWRSLIPILHGLADYRQFPRPRPSILPAAPAPSPIAEPPIPAWAPIGLDALTAPPGAGEVHVYLASLDEPPLPGNELRSTLEASEIERAARFHFEVHRRRFIHGRGLLRQVLGRVLDVPPASLRFETGAAGKPRLASPFSNRPPHLDFNLSHSADLALVALSDGAAIGADIEAPRAVPELAAIARQNFAPSERACLESLPVELQADAFLACWTRKEAFVKALGGGLSIALDSFEVSLDPRAPAALLACADPDHPCKAFTLAALRTPPGAWSAIVVRRANALVRTFSLR